MHLSVRYRAVFALSDCTSRRMVVFQTSSRPSSAAKKSDRPPSAPRARRTLQRQMTSMLPALQEQAAAYDNKDYKYCIRTVCEHEEVYIQPSQITGRFITFARRYCDPSCLFVCWLVGWFVC